MVNAVGDAYTGSEACGRCHGRIGDSYRHTAHALASRPADKKYIKGSFLAGKNVFSFSDHGALPVSVEVVMEERDSGLFQTAHISGRARRSERFGVVVGSGRKAQSYLYWRGNQLLQLPVSYFSATDSWANSPGFPGDQVKFNRLIPAHCMECHSTVSELLPTTETIPGPNPPAFFDRSRMIYGIGCENCHGPGARHVAYELEHPAEKAGHPEEKAGRFIVNPALLSRSKVWMFVPFVIRESGKASGRCFPLSRAIRCPASSDRDRRSTPVMPRCMAINMGCWRPVNISG